VGGGQLGKMLLADARRMDIACHVLDPAADAPCALGAHQFTRGSLTDYDTVLAFGRTCHTVTIEIEHVNVDALAQLEAEGIPVFPQPAVLRVLQNKITQKAFYDAQGLATLPWQAYDSLADLQQAVAAGSQPLPFVWKSATGGYDGKGVAVVRTPDALEGLPEGACLAEQLADIQRELAVVVARTPEGQMACYPTIEMEFDPEANLVRFVFCPAQVHFRAHEKAYALATRTAEALGVVGLLAVELFYTTRGEVLINECAPRPHNSAHFTIEAAYTSQFEQHLRAILGLPLGSPALKQPAVMLNLTGEPGHSGPATYEGLARALAEPGTSLHLYGKAETRPHRKMGHITVVAPTRRQATRIARYAHEHVRVVDL